MVYKKNFEGVERVSDSQLLVAQCFHKPSHFFFDFRVSMILYKNKLLLFSKDAFNLNNRKTS